MEIGIESKKCTGKKILKIKRSIEREFYKYRRSFLCRDDIIIFKEKVYMPQRF